MKHLSAVCMYTALAMTLLLLPVGASGDDDDRTIIQFSEMFDNDTEVPEAGAAILTRSDAQVDVSLHLTDLGVTVAYTVWWIVFNDPSDCTPPECGLDDFVSGIGQGFYATGFVSGNDGTANAYATLREGPIPAGADRLSEFFGLDPAAETGLEDPFDAEIHIIVRSHGSIIAGGAASQLGSFDGLCGPPPGFANCADVQFAVFPAADGDDDDDDDDEDDDDDDEDDDD